MCVSGHSQTCFQSVAAGILDARGIHGDPDVIPYFHTVKVVSTVLSLSLSIFSPPPLPNGALSLHSLQVGKIQTSESDERLHELHDMVNQRCPVARLFKTAVPNFTSELVRV